MMKKKRGNAKKRKKRKKPTSFTFRMNSRGGA
jgi:hypothetical protein